MRLSIEKWGKRGFFAASIVLCAAILIALNAVVGLVTDHVPALQFDLTKSGVFKLDSRTAEFLSTLKEEVVINVLAREDAFANVTEYNAQANEVFRRFADSGGKVKLRYIDYVRDPSFAAAYPGLTIKHGDILVTPAVGNTNRYFLVKTEDLFNYVRQPSGELVIASSKAEQTLLRAISAVASGDPIELYIATGHGETVPENFYELLESNNYSLSAGNLITGDIPSSIKIIFIVAPKTDYSAEELARLDAFLINGNNYGKTVFYCADAEQSGLPALAGFLREWGVSVEDGAVFETDEKRVYNYHPFYAVADFTEAARSWGAETLAESEKPMLMPVCRPLKTVYAFRNNYSAKTLLEFAKSSGVRPSDAPETFVARDATIRGPLPALVLSAYSVTDRATGRAEKASYLVVSGSSGMLDEYAAGSIAFSNADFLLNLLSALSGRGKTVPLSPKSFSQTGLMLSQNAVNTLGLFFIVVIPAAMLACGIIYWLSRKRFPGKTE